MTSPEHSAWFVTGTDTGIGKTLVACAILHALRAASTGNGNAPRRVVGMKPVAAGLESDGRNEDADRLMAASSIAAPYTLVNPYALRAAVAPHIAAAQEGIAIELPRIVSSFEQLRAMSDAVVVEGVGGFRVPLGKDTDTADLAIALGLPVILVVGMRLGCINHALLSQQAILASGLQLSGWVANCIDPGMLHRDDNIAALRERIRAPLLGAIPYGASPQQAALALRVPG